VLILDEPASGLDPRARVEIRELMLELARMGKTIFFSTHILADVAEICSHIGIMEGGKLLVSGSLAAVQQHLRPTRQVQITVLHDVVKAEQLLNALPGVQSVQIQGWWATISSRAVFNHPARSAVFGQHHSTYLHPFCLRSCFSRE
jgi:ABC-2 type transport system ATP-binding protein